MDLAWYTAPAGYTVRIAGGDDVVIWTDAIDALHRVNGIGGVYFTPYSAREPIARRSEEQLDAYRVQLALPIVVPKWRRIWLAFDTATGSVAGQIDLKGPLVLAEIHRCALGLGVAHAHHRKGLGRALVAASIEWAGAQQSIAWIDLGVFGGNAPARALYGQFGFVENGVTRDRFRIDGHSIDDVSMSLRL